jgi:hypothetical protein
MLRKNGPLVLGEQPQKDELHPEQMLKASKIAKLYANYMMPAMNILHKPIDM